MFVWFAVAAVAALSGYYLALAVRRWAQREETTHAFTFQDLRDMRARGEIDDGEFSAMRAALLARLDRDALDEDAAPDTGEQSTPQSRHRSEPPPDADTDERPGEPRPDEPGPGD